MDINNQNPEAQEVTNPMEAPEAEAHELESTDFENNSKRFDEEEFNSEFGTDPSGQKSTQQPFFGKRSALITLTSPCC